MVDEPQLAPRLALEHAEEVWIAHRRERVVLHPAFREQDVADEKVALEDHPPVFGEGGARNGEGRIERGEERVRHRADVAAVRRVEGGAVLEVESTAARGAQPRK